jgi:SAM-dependent methyltransferase
MKPEKYDKIAIDYHRKRKYPWRDLENFIKNLNQNIRKDLFVGVVLDLGCANGRNFTLLKKRNNKLIALDNSLEFIHLAKDRVSDWKSRDSRGISLIVADMNQIPFRENSISTIVSIAAIHHIRGKIKRENVINQVKLVLKREGKFLLTLWRKWQKKFRKYFLCDFIKRKIYPKYKKIQKNTGLPEFGDKYIPWTLSDKNLTIERFYHFFSKKEVQELLKDFDLEIIQKKGGPNKKDNFFILAKNS